MGECMDLICAIVLRTAGLMLAFCILRLWHIAGPMCVEVLEYNLRLLEVIWTKIEALFFI